MARIGSLTSEALSRRKDRLSSGLSILFRDHKVSKGASRADVLLGIPSRTQSIFLSSPQSRGLSRGWGGFLDEEGPVELKEEDVWAAEIEFEEDRWGADEGAGSWSEFTEEKEKDVFGDLEASCVEGGNDFSAYAGGSNGSTETLARTDTLMGISNGVRRMGLDREPGLSALLSDAAPALIICPASISPLTRAHLATRQDHPAAARFATASRMIPPPPGSAAQRFYPRKRQVERHQSAPVNVPDWSKILCTGKDAKNGKKEMMPTGDEEEEEEEDGAEGRLPPHELVARESARGGGGTLSMCEGGVGRTLKGRDLRRVRTAVWRQTGFLD